MTPDELAAITPEEVARLKGIAGSFPGFPATISTETVSRLIAALEAAWERVAELEGQSLSLANGLAEWQAKYDASGEAELAKVEWASPIPLQDQKDIDDMFAHLLKRMPVEWIRERLAEREKQG